MAMTETGGIMSQAERLVRRIRDELQANPRARIGVIAIGAIMAAYGLVLLGDLNDAARRDYAQAHLRLLQLQNMSSQSDWAAQAEAQTKLQAALEARLWRAETEGLALAQLQDWASAAAKDAGLEHVQVTTERMSLPSDAPPGVSGLTATISGTGATTVVAPFLEKLYSGPHEIVINRLRVSEAPIARVETQIYAFFRPEEPAAGKS